MASEDTGPVTALVVPVPVADWLVGRGGPGPAQVTLLAPFVPRAEVTDGLLGELEALFSDVVPFPFDLDQVSAFPSGMVYLAPQPPTPFRQLTTALARRFPQHAPYDGSFAEIVPHVTVPLLAGETLAEVERLVREHGPLQGLATEVQLVCGSESAYEVVAVFPFGTAGAGNYRFTVQAINAIGDSQQSVRSNLVAGR